MNIISQLMATLSHGSKECQTIILVQKGVSLELLLGTDVLTDLGFFVVDGARPGPMRELLQGRTWEHTGDSPKAKQGDAPSLIPVTTESFKSIEENQNGKNGQVLVEENSQGVTSSPACPTVKLIRALRLPARHAKVIKFRTELSDTDKDTDCGDQTLMFEPAQQELEEHGLQLEPSVVEPLRNGTERECTMSLVIENPNAHPVFLPANQLIGYLQPAKCLSKDEAVKVLHSQVNFMSNSSNVNSSDTQQRCQTIWETVHVDKSTLQE